MRLLTCLRMCFRKCCALLYLIVRGFDFVGTPPLYVFYDYYEQLRLMRGVGGVE